MKDRKTLNEPPNPGQDDKGERATLLHRRLWQMYLQVGFIGLLVAVTVWYAMSTGSRIAAQYAPLVDAAMEIKLEATTAHLWFEEIIGGDRNQDIAEVWLHLDQAEWYAHAMLDGGMSDKGVYIPLGDSKLRESILVVLEEIRSFRNIAKERLARSDRSSIGSDIDQRFDAVFKSFIAQADDVANSLQHVMKRDFKRFQSIQLALLVSCLLITGVIGLILHRFQRRQSANVGMLKASNQQLMASEQQLQAANQQLRAGEHQLKAANQQLAASEQQLKASNQQLGASEQQLKASNLQLLASEQQLRASNLQLRQSQQMLALHVQQTPLAVIQWDLDFRVKAWNRSAEEVFGFTFEEAIGRHAAGLIVPESARQIVDDVWRNLLAQKGGNRSTNENVKKNNETILCEWYNTPLVDDDGKTIGVASLVLDITERKRAEQNAHDMEQIVERSLNEIYIFDAETLKFVQVNYGARENIGYTLEELTKLTPLDIKPKFTREAFVKLVEPLTNGVKELITFETVHKRKDKSLYNVEVHLQLSRFLDKPVFVAIILDITETKRLQALESRAERLETAGTIAGQVAHDFNNLLAPMMAYPEFIREELPRNHPSLQYLDQIEKAAEKIAEINQDLLAMGRRGHYNREVLNLNTVVQQAVADLKPIPKTLVCELILCEELMDVLGGGAQIHRVVSNLLHNARDAMQDIGQITIRTENYYVDDVSVVYGRVPKGEYVKLTVADTGCGIPDDIIQKIFDPFFTSKSTDRKRGSGLGMSVVDAVIRDHKGYIDLSTKVGKGTSFFIYFPITRESTDSQESDVTCGGNETVLVVDDDAVQREVSARLLEKLGYSVSSVESGEQAVSFLGENLQNLIILDMVMPGGIDGAETYRKILEICPHQKAIILSGFSESDRVLEAQKLGAGAFVRKPITRKAIAAAVRTELDR